MTDWHLDRESALRYATGAAEPVFSASAEAHLVACARCRSLLVPLVDRPRLDAVWAEVAERVDAPRRGLVERMLAWAGVHRDTARLLSATPSLRVSWLLAVAASLAFAVAAAAAGPRGTLLFLTLAPVLPVLGVAVSYGRAADPMYELTAAAPYSGFRLLLLRAAAVLVSTSLLVTVAGLLLPGSGWLGAAWLVPAFALTALTLALSARFPLVHAAAGVTAVWVGVVMLTQAEAGGRAAMATGSYAAFGATGQIACLLLAAGSVALLSLRHRRYTTVLGRTS